MTAGGFTPQTLPQALDITVWSLWIPLILGAALFLYGLTGHLAAKRRHPACVVGFTLLAVLFLVWQIELNDVIAKLSEDEELKIPQSTSNKIELDAEQMM